MSQYDLINMHGRRLQRMVVHEDLDAAIFSLEQLPIEATVWGGAGLSRSEKLDILVMKGTSKTVRLWIVGEIASAFFFKDGKPSQRVSVMLSPLCDATLPASRRLLSTLSEPGAGTFATSLA